FDPSRVQAVCLDEPSAAPEPPCDRSPPSGVHPGGSAYVIYTSGSTGRPKGVLIEHRNVVAFSYWARSVFTPEELKGTLAATSIAFDLSVFEILVPLCWGGRVLLAKDALELPRLPFAGEVMLLNTVPSAMSALLASGGVPRSVRVVNLAGEPLREALCEQIHALGHVERLHNLYGPSETTTYSTYTEVERGHRPTIGRPVGNTQTYVLDADLRPVPIGVPGELYIGGAGVARGYVRRPALTSERFVADPFRGDQARMYRTGDLVRRLPDGLLEFLGRVDHQVKVRGYRIELGEIETVLLAHPRVREAVVVAREDTPGDTRLVAYVVPREDRTPSTTSLREHLREKLPAYMEPSDFVLLDALPLTPNGKVNRSALPSPARGRPEGAAAAAAPRSAVEELVAEIMAQVLDLPRVDVFDNFFELGGHSLLATQVISRLRRSLGVEVPLRALFEAPTVAGLAASAEKALRAGMGVEAPPITPGPRDGQLPLSFSQQRLWFLAQLDPDSPTYSIPSALRLSGALEVEILRHAVEEVVRRHETVRTTFVMQEGQPAQVIHPPKRWSLPVIDLSGLPEGPRAAEVARLAREEAARPFDLERGPLAQTTLLRLGTEEHVLLVTMHHIISDGWSLTVLQREVSALYTAFAQGLPSPYEDLPIQYADYAAWQRRWLSGEVLERQLEYWQEKLRGAPVLDLPTDRPRPPEQTFRGRHHRLSLPPDLAAGLERLAREQGATIFMTLLAAFQALLSRYSGQGNVCVGTPVANRHRAEIEPLIGFFVNTLVMRADLSDDPPFVDLLAQVRESTLKAQAHQDLPFELLVDALGVERDLSRSPLFQVFFVLDKASTGRPTLGHLHMEPLPMEVEIAKFDLTLALEHSEGHLSGALEYNADLFDESTIARMAGHIEVLLYAIVAEPRARISELPLLTASERRGLLDAWSRTDGAPAPTSCAHELFDAQVERTPDVAALVFEGRVWSYRELYRWSNQLAHRLRSLGVRRGTLVGICVERCPEMVVAMIAVQKAGGAYVPLDASYPVERLAFMIEDTGLPLILTQQHIAGVLPADGRARHLLVDDESTFAGQPDDAPESGASPDDIAYVIFTSGSTGQPKGVMVRHRGLCNLALEQSRIYDVGVGRRALQYVRFGSDVCTGEIFTALLSGATLCVAPDERAMLGPELLTFLRDREISLASVPPSVLIALAPEPLPALHTLITGGEPCPPEVVDRWARGRRFFNGYGPTETTVTATIGEYAGAGAKLTLGRPLANVEVYVLDAHLEPVPVGVTGELYIGGVGVAQGYLNRPGLSAERFVPSPFSAAPGARLYRTGDRIRWLSDGRLEFLGRVDEQVKIRGFRVEPGEIESHLCRIPGVRHAVVVAREETPGKKRLVAYLVLDEGAPTVAALRKGLAEELPPYMVPSAFVRLDTLPLQPNGKVDRRALPAPSMDRAEPEESYAAPTSPIEQRLASIWQNVLRLERIGVHDNFFAIGGDSILTIQIIWQAKQAGLLLTPKQIFQHPTIAELARVTGQAKTIAAEQGLVTGEAPLTPIQRWFFELDWPAPHHFNQSLLFEVPRALDTDVLGQALAALAAHHDALRLRFSRSASGWTQVHATPDDTPVLERIDLSTLPEPERAAALEARAAELQASLHLTHGPLMRVAFFDLGEELGGRLLLIVHHLVVDGVSWRILLQDMEELHRR
ncbi:MAG TPA: amino acid adenylation domain-containing protein, partial [Candidatus Nanopelagicales bacterium]|nr:amino acid adenylation domain-containing protein [Candidatus Nanopelagicales bacterium]